MELIKKVELIYIFNILLALFGIMFGVETFINPNAGVLGYAVEISEIFSIRNIGIIIIVFSSFGFIPKNTKFMTFVMSIPFWIITILTVRIIELNILEPTLRVVFYPAFVAFIMTGFPLYVIEKEKRLAEKYANSYNSSTGTDDI